MKTKYEMWLLGELDETMDTIRDLRSKDPVDRAALNRNWSVLVALGSCLRMYCKLQLDERSQELAKLDHKVDSFKEQSP